jgi:hypothetical protein
MSAATINKEKKSALECKHCQQIIFKTDSHRKCSGRMFNIKEEKK